MAYGYYVNYSSSSESEPYYDSESSEVRCVLRNSPTHATFYEYIRTREEEILIHNTWKTIVATDPTFAKEIERDCGMTVYLQNERVTYVYRPKVNERIQYPDGHKFKVTLVYMTCLRKWFISLGRSRLPPTVNLNAEARTARHDPVSPKIRSIVFQTKQHIDIYMERFVFVYRFFYDAKQTYRNDIEFNVNKRLTEVSVKLQERAWPKDIQKTSIKDTLVIIIQLDESCCVHKAFYTYFSYGTKSKETNVKLKNSIEQRLAKLCHSTLDDGFEVFMRGE